MFEEKAPLQYSPEGQMLKKFLHTKLGAWIGYKLGVSGFNRIDAIHDAFKRKYNAGDKIRGNEFIKIVNTGIETFLGVYSRAKISHQYNSRVNKGADLVGSLITGTSLNSISSPLPPKYIALSTTSLTPAAGDTTLSGETSVAGLGRIAGTQGGYTGPVALDGSASYTVSYTFTLTGAPTTVNSAALFDAASTGNLFVEANLSTPATMATLDTLAITWTVNY